MDRRKDDFRLENVERVSCFFFTISSRRRARCGRRQGSNVDRAGLIIERIMRVFPDSFPLELRRYAKRCCRLCNEWTPSAPGDAFYITSFSRRYTSFALPSSHLSIHQSIIPSIHPSIYVSIRPSNHPSIRSSVRPSIRSSVRPSVCPSVRSSVRPFVRPSVHSSVSPSVRPSARPSVSPSVRPPVPPVPPSVRVDYYNSIFAE